MDFQQIKDELIAFLHQKSQVTEPITEEMSFRDDLGLDSVDLTELIFLVEDLLGEPIEDADLVHLTSVSSAMEFFNKRKGAVH